MRSCSICVPGGTVAELLKQVSQRIPALAGLLVPGQDHGLGEPGVREAGAPVHDGDEVALMPPFSGGSGLAGHVRIQQEPFSVDGRWNG